MNEPSSVLRTAATTAAARAIKAEKLQVIGREWQSGEHRLDLVRFMPDGSGWEPIERATSLGMVSDFAAADKLRVAWTHADPNGCERSARGDCAAALELRMGEMR